MTEQEIKRLVELLRKAKDVMPEAEYFAVQDGELRGFSFVSSFTGGTETVYSLKKSGEISKKELPFY